MAKASRDEPRTPAERGLLIDAGTFFGLRLPSELGLSREPMFEVAVRCTAATAVRPCLRPKCLARRRRWSLVRRGKCVPSRILNICYRYRCRPLGDLRAWVGVLHCDAHMGRATRRFCGRIENDSMREKSADRRCLRACAVNANKRLNFIVIVVQKS